jgi:hypothetical protein
MTTSNITGFTSTPSVSVVRATEGPVSTSQTIGILKDSPEPPTSALGASDTTSVASGSTMRAHAPSVTDKSSGSSASDVSTSSSVGATASDSSDAPSISQAASHTSFSVSNSGTASPTTTTTPTSMAAPASAPVAPPPIVVTTGGESIYRTIMNRLTALEANHTLYARYVEQQTGAVREMLKRLGEDVGRLEGIVRLLLIMHLPYV